MMVERRFLLLSLVWSTVCSSVVAQNDRLELRDGDRVVLLGATFVERAQQFGHLEAALAARPGGTGIVVRNLGWSADTVFADSRGIFDSPEKGFGRMLEHVRTLQPTVIVMCYGQNEALDTSISTEQFARQYEKLVNELKPLGARIWLVSPHELLPAPDPIPSPVRFQPLLQEYTAVVRDVAARTEVGFVDLLTSFTDDVWRSAQKLAADTARLPGVPADHPDLLPKAAAHWTANGMHWNETGYLVVSQVVAERITGEADAPCVIEVDPASRNVTVSGGRIRSAVWADGDETLLRFELQRPTVSPLPTRLKVLGEVQRPWRVSVFAGDTRQSFDVSPATQSGTPLTVSLGADPQYEQLRTAVVRKNRLYFHRWRPQNITYLFGFRKHEQGQNAVEIPKFDPLVAEMEQRIEELRQPGWVTVELSLRGE